MSSTLELTSAPTIDHLSIDAPTDWLRQSRQASAGKYGIIVPELTGLFEEAGDLPTGYIGYNPSAIWTVRDAHGNSYDIMYERVETDHADATVSHLGKTVCRPRIVDLKAGKLTPYYDAQEIKGEDACFMPAKRRLSNGKVQDVWYVSSVIAEAMPDRPNEVGGYHTAIRMGESLDRLELVAKGPEWMKDIRVVSAAGPLGTELDVYGRPQPRPGTGNISYVRVNDPSELNEDVIANAEIIDEALLPFGSGVWGGVNTAIQLDPSTNLLVAHRAWYTGDHNHGRHYEGVLYKHDLDARTVEEIGVFAMSGYFPSSQAKEDESVDLHDVVFPGGGYNGSLEYMSYGLRDGRSAWSKGLKVVRRAGYPAALPSELEAVCR